MQASSCSLFRSNAAKALPLRMQSMPRLKTTTPSRHLLRRAPFLHRLRPRARLKKRKQKRREGRQNLRARAAEAGLTEQR